MTKLLNQYKLKEQEFKIKQHDSCLKLVTTVKDIIDQQKDYTGKLPDDYYTGCNEFDFFVKDINANEPFIQIRTPTNRHYVNYMVTSVNTKENKVTYYLKDY